MAGGEPRDERLMGMAGGREAAATSRGRLAGERGYTLIEVLVVIAVLLFVIGALVDVFSSASKAEVDQSRRAGDQQAARQAMDRMRKDIHCATNATVSQVLDGAGNPTNAWLLDLPIPVGCLVDLPAGASGVQWCTAPIGASSIRYGLYRTFNTPANTSCDAANAEFQVDYLIRPNVWT